MPIKLKKCHTTRWKKPYDRSDNFGYAVNGVNWGYTFCPALAQQINWTANTHTLEFVIKDFSSQAGTGYIMYTNNREVFGVTSTAVFWRMYNGTNLDITATLPGGLDLTKWIYVRLEYDKENQRRKIFVNNTSIYDAAATETMQAQYRNFLIHFTNLSANGNFFAGKVRSIAFYGRLLTTEEIEHRCTPAGNEYVYQVWNEELGVWEDVTVPAGTETVIRPPLIKTDTSFFRPLHWYEFEKNGSDYGTNSNNMIKPFATQNYDVYIPIE